MTERRIWLSTMNAMNAIRLLTLYAVEIINWKALISLKSTEAYVLIAETSMTMVIMAEMLPLT